MPIRSGFPDKAVALTWLSLIVACSGCVRSAQTTTTRMALAPSPGVPPALDGSTGIALGVRALPVLPKTMQDKGAFAFPYVQPELSGVVKVGEHFLFSARVAGAGGTFPLHHPSGGARVAADAAGFEAVLGIGVQFKFGKWFGAMAAAEGGMMLPAVTSNDSMFGVSTAIEPLPAIRAATGMFFEYGPLRVYVMLLGGDLVGNDFTSMRTTTCVFSCTVRDTGSVMEMTLIGVGGGARIKLGELLSIGAEAYTSTGEGTVIPLSLSAVFRVGNFEIPVEKRKKVKRQPPLDDGLTPPPMVIPRDEPAEIPPPML